MILALSQGWRTWCTFGCLRLDNSRVIARSVLTRRIPVQSGGSFSKCWSSWQQNQTPFGRIFVKGFADGKSKHFEVKRLPSFNHSTNLFQGIRGCFFWDRNTLEHRGLTRLTHPPRAGDRQIYHWRCQLFLLRMNVDHRITRAFSHNFRDLAKILRSHSDDPTKNRKSLMDVSCCWSRILIFEYFNMNCVYWLVVWNMNFMTFPSYWEWKIIPTDFHIFQRGR